MKTIKLTMALVALMVAGGLQAQNNSMELSIRQQSLAAIAANEAKGDINALKREINTAFEAGLTVSEIKEALSHLYAYTGFPRSLNALGALQQVIADRQAQAKACPPGREADALPADYDALKQGTEVQTRLTGQPFNYTFAPQTDYYLKAHLFGDIFARNNLSFADREIVTVSAISALPGCEPQLKAHVSGARNMGVSDQQLQALPAVLLAKAGADEARRCTAAVNQVCGVSLPQVPAGEMPASPWPLGEKNPYGQFFVGQSYLAPLADASLGLFNVTFEPGCRNNWHVHHRQVQVLICVSGRGWYQEWGKPAVPMTPGTVVAIPAEMKHWHGAARDSWFQHVTYHTQVQEGASNEWLEPVSDEQYKALQ